MQPFYSFVLKLVRWVFSPFEAEIAIGYTSIAGMLVDC